MTAAPSSPVRVGLVLGALMAPTSLGISAPAVALPQLGADLGLAGPQTAWVLAGYALTLAVGTALSGRIADLRGLRRTMLGGTALLLGGSVLAALSSGFGALLAGRLVQGAGGAAVSIAALGTISATLSDADRARALAALTGVIAAVSGAGSLIGGLLTDVVGWRAVLALPALAVLSLPAAARLAPSSPREHGRLDLRGAALLAGAAGSTIVLLQARSTGLARLQVLAVTVIAVACLGGLVAHVRHRPDGFLPTSVIVNRAFLRYALVGMSLFAGYLSMLFAAPLLLAQRQGWGPLQIGLVLLPAAAAAVVSSRVVGSAVRSSPDRRIATVLTLISATGLLAAALVPHTAATVLGLAAAVSAFAGGQVVLVGAVPRLVPAAVTGAALALFNFLFIFGGSVGSAATGGLVEAFSLPTALALVALLPLAGAALARQLLAPNRPFEKRSAAGTYNSSSSGRPSPTGTFELKDPARRSRSSWTSPAPPTSGTPG